MNNCLQCSNSVYVKGLCRKHYRTLPENRQKELEYREKYLRSQGHKKRVSKWNKSVKGKNAVNSYQKTVKGRYNFSKQKTKKQNKEFTLTLEQYEQLLSKPCHYDGVSLFGEYGVGLDRIDNKKGYTLENVLPCCGTCNKIRGDNLTVEEMKAVAKLLKDIRNVKQTD